MSVESVPCQRTYISYPGFTESDRRYIHTIGLPELFRVVAEIRGLTPSQALARNRKSYFSETRHIYYYFARKYIHTDYYVKGQGLSGIGKVTGHDHATVIYGLRRIRGLYETDKKFREVIDILEAELLSRYRVEKHKVRQRNEYPL